MTGAFRVLAACVTLAVAAGCRMTIDPYETWHRDVKVCAAHENRIYCAGADWWAGYCKEYLIVGRMVGVTTHRWDPFGWDNDEVRRCSRRAHRHTTPMPRPMVIPVIVPGVL